MNTLTFQFNPSFLRAQAHRLDHDSFLDLTELRTNKQVSVFSNRFRWSSCEFADAQALGQRVVDQVDAFVVVSGWAQLADLAVNRQQEAVDRLIGRAPHADDVVDGLATIALRPVEVLVELRHKDVQIVDLARYLRPPFAIGNVLEERAQRLDDGRAGQADVLSREVGNDRLPGAA